MSASLGETRYFLEGAYPPRDLRLALVEASEGKVGSPMDRILLMCFNYNPTTGKYSMTVLTIVRIASAVMVAMVMGFWGVSWRRGKRQAQVPTAFIPRDSKFLTRGPRAPPR